MKYFPKKLRRMIDQNIFHDRIDSTKVIGSFVYQEYQNQIRNTFDNFKRRIVYMKGMYPIHSLEEFIIYFANKFNPEGGNKKIYYKSPNSKPQIEATSVLDWCWRAILVCKALGVYAKVNNFPNFKVDLKTLRDKREIIYKKIEKYFGHKGFNLSLADWKVVNFMCSIYNRYLNYLVEIHAAALFLDEPNKNYLDYSLSIHSCRNIPLPPHMYMDLDEVFGFNMIILGVELCFYTKKKIAHNTLDMICAVWLYKYYLEKIDSNGGIYYDVLPVSYTHLTLPTILRV